MAGAIPAWLSPAPAAMSSQCDRDGHAGGDTREGARSEAPAACHGSRFHYSRARLTAMTRSNFDLEEMMAPEAAAA